MKSTLLDLLVTFAGIIMLATFWHHLWRQLGVSYLKRDLERAKMELFKLTATEAPVLKVRSLAYHGVREELDAMIHHAHRVSLLSFLLSAFFLKNIHEKRFALRAPLYKFNELTAGEQQAIRKIEFLQEMALLKFLFLSSPLAWFVAFFALIGFGIAWLGRFTARIWEGGLSRCRETFRASCARPLQALRSWGFDVVEKALQPAVEFFEQESGQQLLVASRRHPPTA